MTTTSTTRRTLRLALRSGALCLLLALTAQPLLAQQTPRPSRPQAVPTPLLSDRDLDAERAEWEQQMREQEARMEQQRQEQEARMVEQRQALAAQEARMAQHRQALQARLAKQRAAQGPVSTTAPSAVFTVDDTGDAPDAASDGTCATAGGVCTLRAALEEANATAAADVIAFDIAGAGPHTIQPLSALPIITQPVHLDGTTEPDFAGTPVVELDGSLPGADVDGLVITASGSTVEGLVINRFGGSGVHLSGAGATGNTISGNYIGTDATGTQDLGNSGDGVQINGAPSNRVGTDGDGSGDLAERNLISGNGSSLDLAGNGVSIGGAGATGNTVAGNYIGTDVTGTQDLGNSGYGVFIVSVSSNRVGTDGDGVGDVAERNVISGNDGHGVAIDGAGATGNTVAGNYIGTDVTGTLDLGNSFIGVSILAAPMNRVGTDGDGVGDVEERNLISGNDQLGVRLSAGATGNTVAGNYIGTDVTGTLDLGNTLSGVWIFAAPSNRVGTDGDGSGDLEERNLISGNDLFGVYIQDPGATGNTVAGNYIGTDVTGTLDLGNSQSGVVIHDAPSNRVGTDGDGSGDTAEPNLISGNDQLGVRILGAGATGNTVAGNFIGTDVTGTQDLGNTLSGVRIDLGASMNTVGGTGAGAGNTIAFNDEAGVVVLDAASTGNALVSNAIFENTALGIDLGDDGVTANDPGDADASPNKLQNWPVVSTVLDTGGGTFDVTYLVDTDPANAAYPLRVEFFAGDVDEEEGRTFLAADTYTAADFAAGAKTVSVTPGGAFTAIVATATDADGNTSEFSVPQPLLTAEKTAVLAGGPDGVAQPGELITYTVMLTNQGAGSTLGLAFNDTVDGNTALDCTTNPPTTTQGSVTACDDATGTVVVDVGGLGAGASVTITLEATVDNPIAAGVEAVCNQGTASASNIADVLTDDPTTPAPDDATCTMVEAAPDLVLTKDDGGATVMPGDDVAYTLTYDNTGTQDANGVEITETVPDNTTYAAANTDAWSCAPGDPAGTTCTLAVGDLAAGAGPATALFAVTVDNPVPAGTAAITNTASIADDGANGADPTPGDNTDGDTTPIDAMPEVVVTKADALSVDIDADGQADPGDTIAYTIVITNNGGEGGTGVVFTDLASDHPGTTLVEGSVTTSQGTVTTGNGAGDTDVSVSVGMIAGGGGTATIMFDVTVDGPLAAGIVTVCNQGTVSDNFPDVLTDDPDVGGAADPTCATVDAAPDLVLTKDDGGAMVMPGDGVAYTLTYDNTGTQDAIGVTLTETVPANTVFNAGASTAGWTCTPDGSAGNTCTLAVGDVAAGAGAATALFAVTVDNPVPAGTTAITNTATIADDGANGDDLNPGDNTASDTTPINAMSQMRAQKRDALQVDADSDGQADPGDTVRYTIVIANDGNGGATDVVLTDTPDANTTLVVGSVTTSQGAIDTGNGAGDTAVQVTAGMVAGGGATVTITFDVTVNTPFPATTALVANQGQVNSTNKAAIVTDDPDTPAPLDPTVTPIDVSADLSLTKTAGTTTPDYASEVPFTLTLTNDGPSEATAVVTDLLPDGLAYVSDTGGGAYDPAKGEWQPGPLAAGATATLSITARVETIAEVTNTAEVTFSSLPDPDSAPDDGQGDDYASVTLTPVAADLALDKKVTAFNGDPNGPGAGDDTVTATFLITVTNHGPSAATGVFVNDPLPEGATLDAAVPTQGLYDLTSTVWTVGALAVGASASLTVTLTAGAGNNLFNRAEVFADQPDQNGGNNLDGAAAQHDTGDLDRLRADLSLSKTVDDPTPSVDDLVTYTITVHNSGPSTTAGVVVADSLPEGLAFVSAAATTTSESCPTCGYDASQGVWLVGHLPKDSTVVLTVTARVTGTGEIVNRAEVVESHVPDPDSVFGDGDESDDDTDTAVITVTPGKLAGVLHEGVASGKGGTELRYELGGNYPNPFNPETVIPFSVPEAMPVTVEVYNLLGQRVAVLVDESVSAGRHAVVWQATDQPSGVYLVRFRAGTFEQVQRITLMK